MAKKPQKENAIGQNKVELEVEREGEGVVEVEDEEEELEKLEAKVNEMAQKVLSCRTTLPDQLKSTLASILAAQRPVIHTRFYSGSESQARPSTGPKPDAVRPESGNEALLARDYRDTEKIRLLKDKILSNAETVPMVLKRMKDCMARIDQLESCNGVIHPAFKRKRTS